VNWFVTAVIVAFVALICAQIGCMTWMPGQSYRGARPPLSAEQQPVRDQIAADVNKLATEIGERHVDKPDTLSATATHIEQRLRDLGYEVRREEYALPGRELRPANIVAQRTGRERPNEIVILGAHYDTVAGTPGADDNASGVAVLLAIAARLKDLAPARTLRLVGFVNEEPPFFTTPTMGSYVNAAGCRQRNEQVVAMIALDGLGYFSSEPESQRYPASFFGLLYPTVGNFLGFLADSGSADLLRRSLKLFRARAQLPTEGAILTRSAATWSDHWAFWEHGFPAILITDTLIFRHPSYHESSDTPDRLDFDRLALITEALAPVVAELTNVSDKGSG